MLTYLHQQWSKTFHLHESAKSSMVISWHRASSLPVCNVLAANCLKTRITMWRHQTLANNICYYTDYKNIKNFKYIDNNTKLTCLKCEVSRYGKLGISLLQYLAANVTAASRLKTRITIISNLNK